ncbi:MAG: hypothetical protein PHC83_07385 [Bacteroidales bacterium]|nr:hypothetical protein [Bacteroidales bacterium]
MKTLFKTIVLLLLSLLFVHCKPEPIEPNPEIDYHEKWLGIYECEVSNYTSSGNPMTGETYSYDTAYKAIVDVAAIGDSMLHIEERDLLDEWGCYANGVRHDVKVNTAGSFKRVVDDNSSSRPYIDGYFNKNGIYIEYRTGSPNVIILISYEGKKLRWFR